MEDEDRTGRLQTIRTERKIEEVAMLVCANHSQSVDYLAAAVGIIHGIIKLLEVVTTQISE